MIRRSPRPKTAFTVIQNRVIDDSRLSFKATGVLIYLLSKPDDWRTSTAQLARAKKEGIDAVRSAMTELEKAGYVRRRRFQDSAGRWQFETLVFDDPSHDLNQPVDNQS